MPFQAGWWIQEHFLVYTILYWSWVLFGKTADIYTIAVTYTPTLTSAHLWNWCFLFCFPFPEKQEKLAGIAIASSLPGLVYLIFHLLNFMRPHADPQPLNILQMPRSGERECETVFHSPSLLGLFDYYSLLLLIILNGTLWSLGLCVLHFTTCNKSISCSFYSSTKCRFYAFMMLRLRISTSNWN
jgi:hypothetical protein